MAWLTQSAAMLGIVGVQAGALELAACQRVMVSDNGWHAAARAMVVRGVGAHAQRIATQDAITEACAVLMPIATLYCCPSALV